MHTNPSLSTTINLVGPRKQYKVNSRTSGHVFGKLLENHKAGANKDSSLIRNVDYGTRYAKDIRISITKSTCTTQKVWDFSETAWF